MSNVISLVERNQIEDAATLWVAKIDRGLSANEKLEFQSWLLSNPDHTKVFMQFAEFWDITDILGAAANTDTKVNNSNEISENTARKEFSKPQSTPIDKSRRYLFATAASIAVVGIVSLFGLHKFTPEKSEPTETILYEANFTTTKRARTTFLPDGSRLTLRSDSRVDVTYSNRSRNIVLITGELHIDVNHEPSRALSVYAAGKSITAVGTAFGVALLSSASVDVLVTEGIIALTSQKPYSQKINNNSSEATHVSAGQLVEIRSQQAKVSRITPQEAEKRLKWQKKSWRFNGESLAEITELLSEDTGYTFQLMSNELKNEKIAGFIQYESLSDLLETLETSFGLKHKRKGKIITLFSQP